MDQKTFEKKKIINAKPKMQLFLEMFKSLPGFPSHKSSDCPNPLQVYSICRLYAAVSVFIEWNVNDQTSDLFSNCKY